MAKGTRGGNLVKTTEYLEDRLVSFLDIKHGKTPDANDVKEAFVSASNRRRKRVYPDGRVVTSG